MPPSRSDRKQARPSAVPNKARPLDFEKVAQMIGRSNSLVRAHGWPEFAIDKLLVEDGKNVRYIVLAVGAYSLLVDVRGYTLPAPDPSSSMTQWVQALTNPH